MVARTSRWLFLSLALILILYIRDLLGQTKHGAKVVEANIRVKIDTPGVLSLLESQLDSFTSPIAVDSNGDPIEGRLPSPVLVSEPLTFDPPSLDFEEQSVGMPHLVTVKVINPSKTQNLHLNSISGESHVFHPSFFKSKVVKAGANEWTTFDVVFLPRVPGAVRDTLYIHTSHGTFDFKVQGVGVPNPFRMRPLLGARIPLNATYSPLITMYNPFEKTLQITEMYSSGGDLHLELLSGQLQGSKSLWEIRPYETKPIARANYFGRAAINHTSFIRVKTSLKDSPSIILPVEVEVSESHGLYLSRELLDFGILKSGETKSLPLFVLNSGPHTVHIKSISVVPDNPSIEIEPTTTFLKPGSKYLKIASVTLTPILGSPKEEQSGHLEIVAEDERRVEYRLQVPFDSTILQGTLAFEKSQTMFRVGKPPFQPLIRNVSLANHFNVPLVLYDIRLSSKAQEYFTVLDFRGPFTLSPTSDWHRPFALEFQAVSSDCLFNTTLRLSTNASLFNIPFYCYDGRVTYTLNSTENPDNEDVLDYGVLSESDSVSKHFFLINPNPIRITIVSFLVGDSIPFTSVELLQIQPADMSVSGAEERVQVIGKKQGAKGPFYVEPDMVAKFRVNVTNPKKLGTFTGELLIHTSFDRVLRVPVYYKTAVGSVKIVPDKNIFTPTFPYAIQKLPLFARSYYPQILGIREVRVDPPDERFYFITERTEKIPHLKPQALTELGTLVFDPLRGDPESVYLGTGKRWSVADYSSQLDTKADRKEFSMLWDAWSSLQDDGLTQFNFSYVVYSEIDTTVPVPTEASLVWPTLYPHKELQFPQTAVGNSSIQVLKLTNPSRHPVVVQPVLLHYYPQPQKIVQILFESGSIENIDFSRSESSFSLDPDLWGYDTSLSRHILIPGGDKNELELRVKFLAHDSKLSSSLLILRNNLTALEYVVMRGRGLEGQFSIDGIHPDTSSLLFQFSPSDLERCSEGATLTEPLKLTKAFRMHNSGTAPMRIRHVGLGQARTCDENGFSVSTCGKDIVIQANKTKKLELSLVPDFTLSRVENTLTLETADGVSMTFPIAVLIPHNMLAACYAVQPHPPWEQKLGFLIMPIWLAILFFVIMLALVRTNFGLISPGNDADLPTVQPTGGAYFDFADITKVLQETLLEKLDSLKKGVNAAQQEQARKPPDKHSHHKQRNFTNPSPTSFHPPSSPPPSSAHSPREPPESTSELRKRITQQMGAVRRDTSWKTNDDRSTKDSRRSDASSMAAAHSPGSARKSERNRTTTESVKRAVDETTKSVSSHNNPQHHHHSNSALGSLPPSKHASDSVNQGQRAHGQTGNASKVAPPPAPSHPPAMTTDQETGMRKFVDQPSPIQQSPPALHLDSTPKVKKPAKLPVVPSEQSGSVPSAPTEGRSSGSSSSSSSLVPTPVPQRRGKGTRKSVTNKVAKGSPTAKQVTSPASAAIVATATPPVLPTHQAVQDHLERKASQSSLRSTDSESTSSSSDKSEKDENQSPSEEKPEIDSNPNPPLAKEPGTGQTIPLLLAQEEYILSKCKPVPDEVASTAVFDNASDGKMDDEVEKDGVVVEVRELEKKEKLDGTQRIKSKKKLRQLQRKEDKLRRKEREKERVKGKEGEERRREQPSGMQEVADSQLVPAHTVEEVEEHAAPSSSVAEEPRTKKVAVVSPKKAKKMELKVSSTKPAKPVRSRTAPSRIVAPPRSRTPPPTQPISSPSPSTQPPATSPPPLPLQPSKDEADDSDDSPEVDQLAHTWGGTELENLKGSPEPSSPSSQPESTFPQEIHKDGSSTTAELSEVAIQSSHPVEAIPISALRAMRARSSKQKQIQRRMDEEDSVQVAHVMSSKNSGSVRRTKDMEKLPPRIVRLSEKTSGPMPAPQIEAKSTQKKKSIPKIFADDISTDSTPSPEPSRSSENELSVKSDPSYVPPTSPHEIAATLLSKNPALKKRKGKSDPHDQDGSDEADEEKYEKLRTMSEEEEHSEKHLWGPGDEESAHKHQMELMRRHFKSPTTLSLDAEPFYPSSDYIPRAKQYKKYHHHPDTPYAHNERHLDAHPEESAFERKYRVREVRPPRHLSLRPPHVLHGNTLTPSPPPYPDTASPFYTDGRGGIEYPESSHYTHVPSDISPYEVSPDEYFSSPNASGRRVALGIEGMPTSRSRAMRSSHLYDDQVYSGSRQQHTAAMYAAAQRRERHARSSPSASLSLWDQPNAYPYTEEETALIQAQHELKQRMLLRRYQEQQQAKMHARRSVDTLSSINHPHLRPSRSTLYAANTPPSSANLWDTAYNTLHDTYPSPHSSDDAFLPESVHAHHLRQQQRQQQLLQEQATLHPRRRRYSSSDNELGGEILQTPTSPGPISSSTGLNKAPGTAFSGMAQARRVAAGSSREHDMWSESPEKSGDNSMWASNIWSLDSALNSTQQHTAEDRAMAAKPGSGFPGNLAEQRGMACDRMPAGNGQSFLENTYDLFKDKNIWGIGTETPSTSILSWAQLKSTEIPPPPEPK